MIRLSSKGDYKKTINYLHRIESSTSVTSTLEKYGEIGVQRLSEATPVQTGLTASSWGYQIQKTRNGYKINFYNTNQNEDYHIVILLMHGHVTADGRWIAANDFVTPVITELCKELQAEI